MNSIPPSIMQSIKPQYCELIAAGKKTIEVRKTRPKLKPPFKVYIYMTKSNLIGDRKAYKDRMAGKVIGKYICDEIQEWVFDNETNSYDISDDDLALTCLTQEQLWEYGKGKTLYGYHISKLKIYDEPKELKEFRKSCPKGKSYIDSYCRWSCKQVRAKARFSVIVDNDDCMYQLTRPPQSWCYVEEA